MNSLPRCVLYICIHAIQTVAFCVGWLTTVSCSIKGVSAFVPMDEYAGSSRNNWTIVPPFSRLLHGEEGKAVCRWNLVPCSIDIFVEVPLFV